MGMFDWIRCDFPLYYKVDQERLYQTKDFDSDLCTYTIGSDGKIIRTASCGTYCEHGAPVGDIYEFTGEFSFYDNMFDGSSTESAKGWVEYKAFAEKGIVTHIELVERRLK